jgi:iron complex outermembrane receptor protein
MVLNYNFISSFYATNPICRSRMVQGDIVVFSFFLFCLYSAAQDSSRTIELDSVVVQAFEQSGRLQDVPAAVNYIGSAALQRFGTASIVEAVNTTSGIRMEERSPGSYRFNIRGSALRSPFGVRNVKVYYNDLPLTDPSGQTYLNALGNYDYGSIEVIKGPGSSFYGAGTGGVLLINSINENGGAGFLVEHTVGGYGLQNTAVAVTTENKGLKNRISFQHQQSDGYREQSALDRNVLNWSTSYTTPKNNTIRTTFLYSDLFYETPGALTLNEYTTSPKAARPAAGVFPGAVEAQAAIYQQFFLAGVSFTQQLSESWQHKTAAYGAYNRLRNPAIRNYGRNNEPHAGGRTVFTWKHLFQNAMLTANVGAEWQQGFASYHVHKNRSGVADSLQSFDDVTNRQGFLFSHVVLDVQGWSVAAGASINQYKLRLQRFYPAPLPHQERTFNNEIAPRFSLMRKWNRLNIYGSIAKGFSSPTTAEAIPTGSAINLGLNAERGRSYDIGLRGTLFNSLSIDVNAFYFSLKNTIVQRRDTAGGDYYINAGRTKQSGIEAALRQPLFQKSMLFQSALWASYTWHHFRYGAFKQLDSDFSGNALPGVAPHTVAAGIDWMYKSINAALTYFYSSELPLNDANTVYASGFYIAGIKVGYASPVRKNLRVRLSAGINNLLDQKYSLGNDINAFGGRYYNAAPRRNFYVTLSLQWLRNGSEQQ